MISYYKLTKSLPTYCSLVVAFSLAVGSAYAGGGSYTSGEEDEGAPAGVVSASISVLATPTPVEGQDEGQAAEPRVAPTWIEYLASGAEGEEFRANLRAAEEYTRGYVVAMEVHRSLTSKGLHEVTPFMERKKQNRLDNGIFFPGAKAAALSSIRDFIQQGLYNGLPDIGSWPIRGTNKKFNFAFHAMFTAGMEEARVAKLTAGEIRDDG